MPPHFATLSRAKAGLLEQPLLCLRPGEDGRLWLFDGDGVAVGFMRAEAWSWWRGGVMAVHEAFEEPVVFRVRRCWSLWPRWSVVDADDELVGTVGGGRLVDLWGRVQFRQLGRTFVLPNGALAAEWREGQLLLQPAVRDEPFSKMLLLAAVLVSRGQ